MPSSLFRRYGADSVGALQLPLPRVAVADEAPASAVRAVAGAQERARGIGIIQNPARTTGILLSGDRPSGWTSFLDFESTATFLQHDTGSSRVELIVGASDVPKVRVTSASGTADLDEIGYAMRRAAGTISSPTAVQNASHIGHLLFYGYDDADYDLGARISVTTSENWTASAHGVTLNLITATIGATGLATRVSINSDAVSISPPLSVAALTLSGILSIDDTTDASSTTTGSVHTDGGMGIVKQLFVGGNLFAQDSLWVNETANANVTKGLTINIGSNDDQAVCLKSSDIATGLTTATRAYDVETDDFYVVQKRSTGVHGGAQITVLGKTTQDNVYWVEAYGGAPSTTDTSTSFGAMCWYSARHDGSNGLEDHAGDANTHTWGIVTSAAGLTTRMLLKASGHLHLGNTTLVALDKEDDVQAVRSLQIARTNGRGIVSSRFDRPAYDYKALRQMNVVGEKDEDGKFLICIQPYLNLHDGAIWQLHVASQELVEENRALHNRIRKLEGLFPSIAPN